MILNGIFYFLCKNKFKLSKNEKTIGVIVDNNEASTSVKLDGGIFMDATPDDNIFIF